jgi:glycosyltransferase involved in cell wall biosynthesis
MDIPLVSVIIPTHNRASMLPRAIRSVQRQTYPHLEIIVIDDASVDNTPEVVKSFEDPRIHYIRHDTNRGGSASRNTGIRAATGEYIAFLDDDDEWEPEKTEEQLKVIRDYDAVTCTSFPSSSDVSKLSSKKTVELDELLQGKFTYGGTGVLMAKENVLKQTMFDESLPRCQDWDLFIRIAMNYKIAYLNKPLLRSSDGLHPRITNSVLNVPIPELEHQFRMIHKHKQLFGTTWFKRHMSAALLFGIKNRRDKFSLLAYAIRWYGLANVVRALAIRFEEKMSEGLSRRPLAGRNSMRRGKS